MPLPSPPRPQPDDPMPTSMASALPLPLPQSRHEQVLLLLFRRMAIHGLRDASASMLALDHFGSGFLRTLHLVRAFLHGLARHAQEPLRVAPCCTPRMTRHEGLVLAAMTQACPVALLELAGPTGYRELVTLAHALQAELATKKAASGYADGSTRQSSPDRPLPSQG